MSPFGKSEQIKRLALARELLLQGRDIGFVKQVVRVTRAALLRAGLIYEVMVPDPLGFSEKDGGKVHDGRMLHTGQFRPVLS